MAHHAPALPIDVKFTASVSQAALFPLNLVQQQTYSATLRAYKNRLDTEAHRIFEEDVANLSVPFRDFNPTTKRFDRKNIQSLDELRTHHGMRTLPAGQSPGLEFTKADPQCRSIFIHAPDSRSKLQITKEMMLEIFSFNQIMPGYLDLIFLFGEKTGPNDLKFSAFREQTSLKTCNVGLDDLGRSGQKYELCYNLKTVNRKDIPASTRLRTPGRTEWSVRQAGIFHKFDAKLGTTFWTFTKGSLELEERFNEVTDQDDRPEDRSFDTPAAAFRSSLTIHAMMIHWASESWRWYLQWLDEEIELETERLTSESRVPSKSRTWYQARDLQKIQKLSDQVNDAILALDGNMEVIRALREFYNGLIQDSNFAIRTNCEDYVAMFVKQARNANYDLKLQYSRAKALSSLVLERKNLMLQYMNAQTAEKQEELTNSAYRVTISAENEAIVMRIITVVTLVFLPATFVSTFFSTPVISFSQNGVGKVNDNDNNNTDDGADSTLALHRWLEISIPLTVATLVVACCVYIWERRRREKRREKEKAERYYP